jgi:uncharacterized protein with NAD-binding domain and iron-sulfur cluster
MAVHPTGNEAILARALDDLNRQWEATAFYWRDKARDEFERTYLQDLRTAVLGAQRAISAIGRILEQAISECQ